MLTFSTLVWYLAVLYLSPLHYCYLHAMMQGLGRRFLAIANSGSRWIYRSSDDDDGEDVDNVDDGDVDRDNDDDESVCIFYLGTWRSSSSLLLSESSSSSSESSSESASESASESSSSSSSSGFPVFFLRSIWRK